MQRRVIVAIVAAGVLGVIVAGITVLVAPGIGTAIKDEWDRRSAEAARRIEMITLAE
jgi:hypothetical protein